MAASHSCQWWFAEDRGGTSDNLVAGLARVAFELLIGLLTEGITCRGQAVREALHWAREADSLWARMGTSGEAETTRMGETGTEQTKGTE